MANPRVRPHLHFLPEDSGEHLAEAWQASRWRSELDPNVACPMVRIGTHDYFVYKPAQLDDGSVCMPVRWFTCGNQTLATAWKMVPLANGSGWVVLAHAELELDSERFLNPFPSLISTYHSYRLPDPRVIIGELCSLLCYGRYQL